MRGGQIQRTERKCTPWMTVMYAASSMRKYVKIHVIMIHASLQTDDDNDNDSNTPVCMWIVSSHMF